MTLPNSKFTISKFSSDRPSNETEVIRSITTDWGFAFKAQVSYHYGQGNDVNLNWLHLDKTTTELVTPSVESDGNTELEIILGDGFEFEFDPELETEVAAIEGRSELNFDMVNLEFGKVMLQGERVTLRSHFGLQYARVKEELTRSFKDYDQPLVFSVEDSSKFDGVGIRAGIDGSYDFDNGFSAIGQFAAALLVGEIKWTQTITESLEEDPDLVTTYSSADDTMIPTVDGRLAVRYTSGFGAGDLMLEAGWQFATAFQSARVNTALANAGEHGPYFGVKWIGNV